MKKIEEILERELPLHINQSAENKAEKIEINKKLKRDEFLKRFRYGDHFLAIDYPEIDEKLDNLRIENYCLVGDNGKATLLLSEAYKETPNLKIPYIELDVSLDSGVPVAIFLTWNNDRLVIYVPRKGNTIREDTNEMIDNSGIFDFDWEDKLILEKSDLFYIVKDINRQALSKYLLHDIYNAFQECGLLSYEMIEIDRNSCILEFESKLKICC